jgi:metal-responsive CopG/Arc/MetJ family transcriptional regulator
MISYRLESNLNEWALNLGITLNPELIKMLDDQSEKEGVSKSKLIEDVMREHLKNKKENNEG